MKNKRLYFIFWITCFVQTVMYAQNKEISKTTEALSEIDSLKIVLKNAKHDTTRCNILATLSRDENDPKIWQIYNNELKAISEKALKNISVTSPQRKFFLSYLADALSNMGYTYHKEGQNSTALKYFTKSLQIEREIDDKRRMAVVLNNIGNVCKVQGDLPKAASYFKESLKLSEKKGYKKLIGVSLNNLGSIYNRQGDIREALKYYHKCLKMFEELNDKEKIAIALSNIGKVYFSQKDVAKALEYYESSLKLQEEIKDKEGIASSYIDIGIIYKSQNNLKKALN